MGNCLGGGGDGGAEAGTDQNTKSRNNAINRQIRVSKQKMSKEVRLLLLGAGESGKSTIFKQIKILHNNGYTREERLMYKDIVHANTLQSMKMLVTATTKLNIPIEDIANKERSQMIANMDSEALLYVGKIFTPQLGEEIAALWKDPQIQEAYRRRSEFQLNDSAAYYFQNIERISAPDFVPTEQDVLRTRVKTTGIVETEFEYLGHHFKLFDVGGQRNERKKWIHCFQEVSALVFVTSLSEYDQKCYEDDATNRMHESLLLFDEIANSRWFVDTPIILLLNKSDLFQEKIQKIDLKVCFQEYTGGCNFDAAVDFIRAKYQSYVRGEHKVHFFVTCATDTDGIKKVLESMKDYVIKKNDKEQTPV